MGRLRSVAGLLRRNPDFARLYLALLLAFAADWFATVALVGLVLEITDSTTAAALILVLQSAPFLLATPLAGLLADRIDRRGLLMAANVGRAVVCVALLLARDEASLPIAFVVVALLSFGAAFFEPTVSASMPHLGEHEDLTTANALLGAAWGTMVAVGAAIGGLVAASLGRDATFIVYPFLFLASAWLIRGVRRPMRAPFGGSDAEAVPLGLQGMRSTLTETATLARASRSVAALLLTKTTFGVGTGIIGMLAITSDQLYGSGELGVGILFAARGLGALVGPFAARSYATLDQVRVIRGISISFGVFLAGYVLLPLAPGVLLAGVFVFVAHLGGGAQWMLSSFGLQRAAPDRVRGRVMSVDFGLVMLTSSISTILAAWLAGVVGPVAAMYVMLGCMVVAAAAWLLYTRPLHRRQPRPGPWAGS
ncbi:MFS transporter [soil metagenome]